MRRRIVHNFASSTRSKSRANQSLFSFVNCFEDSCGMDPEVDKNELKKRLTPIQWHVTQEKGTERYTLEFTTFICIFLFRIFHSHFSFTFFFLHSCVLLLILQINNYCTTMQCQLNSNCKHLRSDVNVKRTEVRLSFVTQYHASLSNYISMIFIFVSVVMVVIKYTTLKFRYTIFKKIIKTKENKFKD